LSHLWPTGSSSRLPSLITARYFSSCPSDSISRWTPCPPKKRSLRPARRYPRFWIRCSSSEHRRDSNPPEQCAAQRTLRHGPTPHRRSYPSSAFAFTDRPVVPSTRTGEVSRFSCMLFLDVLGVYRLRGIRSKLAIAFRPMWPSPSVHRVGIPIMGFRSSIPGPPMPLSTLR
jgi:hypothetical protein